MDTPQLYYELLEHRWLMSERAQKDVGIEVATADYIREVLDPAAPKPAGEADDPRATAEIGLRADADPDA
jgi:hypothetical protein